MARAVALVVAPLLAVAEALAAEVVAASVAAGAEASVAVAAQEGDFDCLTSNDKKI